MKNINPSASKIILNSFLLLLFSIESLSQDQQPTKTMTETFHLSSQLTPWASGGLLAQVKLEIVHTGDPLEFLLELKNQNTGEITFLLGPGSINLNFRNAVNAPIPIPPIEMPMDLPSNALDPNSGRIEFYRVNEDGTKGGRFRELTVSLDPNEAVKVAVKMGPEVMKQLNAIIRAQNNGSLEVRLGVRALISIVHDDDKNFYGRFRTEETLFFPYQLPRSEE